MPNRIRATDSVQRSTIQFGCKGVAILPLKFAVAFAWLPIILHIAVEVRTVYIAHVLDVRDYIYGGPISSSALTLTFKR